MTVEQVIESVEQLSDGEKLAVIEATARMLQRAVNNSFQSDAIAEAALRYRVDEVTEKTEERPAQRVNPILASPARIEWKETSTQDARKKEASAPDIDVREYYLVQGRRKMAVLAAELSARPDPPPEKMLPRGLFQGLIIDEEDFKAAEWHPTDKELTGE
ncbi:MAG: hypothetical protein KJZ86_17410 [Caldilineaceae bacterium]|nr:hypothetical protein [Caldilineaceae bacterium]